MEQRGAQEGIAQGGSGEMAVGRPVWRLWPGGKRDDKGQGSVTLGGWGLTTTIIIMWSFHPPPPCEALMSIALSDSIPRSSLTPSLPASLLPTGDGIRHQKANVPVEYIHSDMGREREPRSKDPVLKTDTHEMPLSP